MAQRELFQRYMPLFVFQEVGKRSGDHLQWHDASTIPLTW
jgi:hypothetical protein